ncbi:AAA family ATPase [Planktothrix sp. FACHB-1375]|uniref:AAA family ATPase n=4 Tax=Oscillatoriophycideae TaxID=1301283 RepID=A0A926VC61_9CYAN|nr:AAA family ATPase [Aerosakkonema funiforme FACHB-1375]
MFVFTGYQILEQIYESANSLVYRGWQERDNQPVVLKILKLNYPTFSELIKYKQEYYITRSLDYPGIIKVYNQEKYQNTLCIVLEDFGGESLKLWMKKRVFTLLEFIEIAIATTDSLGQIHAANIIHKDINPSNIIFNPATKQLKIIDFGIATQLTRENPTLKNPNVLEGTLPYISPEQTGRMNRALDYRTDFYSLGVTFYELLTGKLPFETDNALELVHCHIAKQPLPPHHINSEIPPILSKIVMKLMAKTAEDRYRSAWGLKVDLENCLNQWRSSQKISDFVLGYQDISDKFQIPQKLYGREAELKTLLSTFERISNSGQAEILLVAGYSGIGKSALVQELYKPITAHHGYFISGKFDQFQRNIPYSAIVSAFKGLIQQILTDTETQLQQWREKLEVAVGTNGQVVIDVIPEVELIIGKQPSVPELGLNEAQNRFNLVFQNFIRVCCSKEHPLVIFLDDLQWADSGTLKIVELMTTDIDMQYLYLIGAYRDNEVSTTHPLMMTLEDLRKQGATINQITLEPLGLQDINQLLADTLHSDTVTSLPLAELVIRKTRGNPFFVNEFLKTLYSENLIAFNLPHAGNQRGYWRWDITEIERLGITDNVVDLMVDKLKKLPNYTQDVLRLAACIGTQFELNTLAIICGKAMREIFFSLVVAMQSGLILPKSELNEQLLIPNYQFLHDRVQQAAYALIGEAQKTAVHLQIGRLLLQNTVPEALSEKIFEIVDHLNIGAELVLDRQERNEIAKLNLMAGQKALAATAYEAALKYCYAGIKFLSVDSWRSCYELTLALYDRAAEAAYLYRDFEQMEKLGETVLQQASALLDKVKVYELKIQVAISQNELVKAIEIGLFVVEMLGVKLSPLPKDGSEVAQLPRLEDLESIPVLTDANKLAAMRIFMNIAAASFIANPTVFVQVILTAVNLCIEHGHSALAPFAYVDYGMILAGPMGNLEAGYYSGLLALKLLEQFDCREIESKVYAPFNGFIRHWKEPARATVKSLLEGVESGLDTGDIEYASYSANHYCSHIFWIGENLEIVDNKQANYLALFQKLKQNLTVNHIKIFHELTLKLRSINNNKFQLVGSSFNEVEMLPYLLKVKDGTAVFFTYVTKAILCYLFKDYSQAIKNADLALEYAGASQGLMFFSAHNFYYSLALLAEYTNKEPAEQQIFLCQVESNQEKMRHWADNAPTNYQHKYELVEAEKARVLGNTLTAMKMYDRAIAGAKENEYINEEALALELAAQFYLALGREKIGQTYMQDAHYAYTQWGAIAKVKDLEEKYPQLLNASGLSPLNSTYLADSRISTSTNSSSNLDLETVMKASQALSQEIELDKLLVKLMKILIENAGAEKGYLILENKGKLLIEASGTVDSDNISVLHSLPIENRLPVGLINYVARLHESVVLNDATREGNFINEPYIKQHQPKSILCAPVLNRGQLTGIIYLENNLIMGAFTSDRSELLRLLSGQAAISITNAKLYAEVKASEKQLRENESRLAQFLNAVPVGVFIADPQGRPYYVNETARQILRQGLVSSTQLDRLHAAYQAYEAGSDRLYPLERDPIANALQGKSVKIDDIELRFPDKIVSLESSGTPIYDEQGNLVYAIAAFQDISDRKKAEAELFKLNKALERFVPQQFLQFLNKQSIVDVELGDNVEKEMSILFSDIRDFTTISETMTPEENFRFINSYLSRMEPAIRENHGFIDKYIGDAIMALFGGSADDAVKAAIAMLKRLEIYNQHRGNSGYVPIDIGIGINTGNLMLGTVGGANRMNGTVISDAVNLASRVESLTKNYGVSLLITHHTFSQLKNSPEYAIRLIDKVKVKGKSELVTVYEVFDTDRPEILAGKLQTLPIFKEALSLYNDNALSKAAKGFSECLRINPLDRVAEIYLQRCDR